VSLAPEPQAILEFWLGPLDAHGQADAAHRKRWFEKDDAFDQEIADRFGETYAEIAAGRREDWLADPRGRLAYVIVLDQFSRNMFRGNPRAYAADPIARRVAKSAIEQGFDTTMTAAERMFLYLPFQHSEDAQDQLLSVNLCKSIGNEDWTDYAVEHKAIIDCFGRFPHRNAVLGRRSTPDEIEFLKARAT
jgi:uncharacterized protein (DUF924 family)